MTVLLTDIDTERAKALAERIRENVERLTGDNPEYAIPQKVTISIGAVVTQENALNPNEIYRLADNALYEAKIFFRKNCSHCSPFFFLLLFQYDRW